MIYFAKKDKDLVEVFNRNIMEINKAKNSKISFIKDKNEINERFVDISKETGIRMPLTKSKDDINKNFLLINKGI